MTKLIAATEEFYLRFHSEKNCVDYLMQIKWPHGYTCEKCGSKKVYRTDIRRLPLLECANCRYQASPIVGTIMEGSSTPLRKWLLAIHLISHETLQINAKELCQIIQVTYKTAWLIMHKIRHAIGKADANIQLSGHVSVTSAVYGTPPYSHSFERLPQESPALVGASMNANQEPDYVKIKLIAFEHLKEKEIKHCGLEYFTKENVEQDTTPSFVVKRFIPLKQRPTYSLFKESRKWIHSTFHGLRRLHLQAYLNEFCFRLNMKLQKITSAFKELTLLCISTQRITYATLINGFNQLS
jgi:hypothetical protein